MPMNIKVVVAHGFLKQRRRKAQRRSVLNEAHVYAGRCEALHVHTCIHLCSPEEFVVAMEVLTRELVYCNIHFKTLQTKILRTGLFAGSR